MAIFLIKVWVIDRIGSSPASRLKINRTSFVGSGGVVEIVNYQLIALFASVLLKAYDS